MVFKINATLFSNNVSTDAVHCAQHAQRKLAIIEICVILTAFLIAILVVFGSCRRRTHTVKLKYLIWAAYVLPPHLISYTMGQMQSAPFHNELFAVWAVFLVLFLENANSISALNLEENENRKTYNFSVVIQCFWMGFLFGFYIEETNFKIPLLILYFLSFLRTGERFQAMAFASRSYGLVRSSKLVADFMTYEHTLSKEEEVDPTCMQGYKYLVYGEEEGNVKVVPPLYQKQLEITHEVITTNKIWQRQGQLLSSTGDPDGRLKDICLSFALCKLLRRRFAGYSMFESSQAKTWSLVRNGLLSNEGDHERVFRVIEVELDFLYDFFYTKYPVLFAKGIPIFSKSMQFIFVAGSCWIVVATLRHYQSPHIYLNLIAVSGHNVDALVTGIAIIAILFMDFVQYLVIMFSNWAKVQWLCCYVQNPKWQMKRWAERVIQIVCNKKWGKPWERKLGQYSLLDSFNHNPSKLLYNCMTAEFIDKPLKGQKENRRIELPVEVKKAIVLSLRTNGQRLSNGEASLHRNGVENEFSWACRLETQTHVIMVWHIATSLCEIAAREEAQMQRESEHFIVATSLSKYCAYLVAFTPRLLPDHAYTTETIFEQVVGEARDLLPGLKTLITRYQKMMTLGEGDNVPTEKIMKRSAVLAKHLIGIEDKERRWKILADFWADMMLFVAPSDDATAHAEHLATGGEFVTHLWALLSHAGILKRDDSAQAV
ncbi:hypothetical protein FH972_000273 [Carpinus fangiana]|uniref:DUF4220 domain-containing protein n=1 Tax=Carpinus fangiana TaxID=176857 RepID=A0A5N6QA52_9ROSI|nr:hypothetical protein FH972_000273 [Carpinus fangiana]